MEKTLFPEKTPYEVKTIVGNFSFSRSIISKKRISQLANLMEDGIQSKQSTKDFINRVERELQLTREEMEESEGYLIETYKKLADLEESGINGVWARIIKNAFAPLFVGEFDLIVGNPPWVNWISLPIEYRKSTISIWSEYDLFEHKGLDARLGKACDDISILMTYVAIDKYLVKRGNLCFVITQTLFKTVGAGEGFRRFSLGKEGFPLKVIQVDDMVDLQPFDSATNRTAVMLIQKGEETLYPVEYHIWTKKQKGSINIDSTFQEVLDKTERKYLKAKSIDGSRQGSWITARPKALGLIEYFSGQSYYQARIGSHTGGANGIYWIQIEPSQDRKQVKIENLSTIGKNKYESISKLLEKDLIYPLLRGRDTKRWRSQPTFFIILPQDISQPNKAYDPLALEDLYPETFKYFENFRDKLTRRAHYKAHFQTQGAPYYSIYNVGPYTFSPYKVVWSEVGFDLEASVISSNENAILGRKIIIPDHTLVSISLENEEEAHFVCSLLNSSPSQLIVRGYVVLHPSPHVLKNIRIPQYDFKSGLHRNLASLSFDSHEKSKKGISVQDIEEQIDELSCELWSFSKQYLRDIKEGVEELK
jgi:hypothetical protein